jgi:hypothetical protein
VSCEERSGFLFAHACDRPVAWSCATCGKSICAEHTRMTESGYGCISCVRLQGEQTDQEREQQQQQQQQQGQGQPDRTTDDPYFYADDDYDNTWDPSDRRAFSSRSTSSSTDESEGDFGAS